MIKFFKKYHRWAGLILLILLILFSISGIIMNHRQTVSGISINRNWLPKNYAYNDWNLAAVRATDKISADSILIYGNTGIWLTDSTFSSFTDFNNGFPNGTDNHKIFKVLTFKKIPIAGTLFGLYYFDAQTKSWKKLNLPGKEANVVDMLIRGDSLLIMTRSDLFSTSDLKNFSRIELPAPAGYDNKTGLFKTLWVIHSGEVYGWIGKLVVDLAALLFIFLGTGGFIMFINKKKLKIRALKKDKRKGLKKQFKWFHRWHGKIGWITLALLVITTLTGVFLRPPLLIAIAEAQVGKIPFTSLDTPNPWHDLLRRIIYIENDSMYVISTQEGFYYSKDNLQSLIIFDKQPPASVMGVTVLEEMGKDTLWVGSFNGLFAWNYKTAYTWDLIDRKPWVKPVKKGKPVGNHKITGISLHFGDHPVIFDYDKGTASPFNKSKFPDMPDEIIRQNPMPLWNVAQEIHTGRIYQFFLSDFYILIVPLTGIFTLILLITGAAMRMKNEK